MPGEGAERAAEVVETRRRLCIHKLVDDGYFAILRLMDLRISPLSDPNNREAATLLMGVPMMMIIGADLRPLRYNLIGGTEAVEPAMPGMYPGPTRFEARQYLARDLELWTRINRLSLEPGVALIFTERWPGPFRLPGNRSFRAALVVDAAEEGIYRLSGDQVLGPLGIEGARLVISFDYRIDLERGYATALSYWVRHGVPGAMRDLEHIEMTIRRTPYRYQD